MESDVRLVKRRRVMEDKFENYDVFISHRGPDTKIGFVGFLYDYLVNAGLRPFLDCKSILKGQDAWTCIEHAIKMTPIALVIFSENFAQSQWCLDELHVMLDTPSIKVLPIFYKVQPFEVGFPERGQFATAFEKLEQRHDDVVIKQWREDLKRASKLNGWEHRATDHSLEKDLVNAIVKEVLELANRPLPLDVGEHVFGVNKVAEGIIQKLDDNKEVIMLGLWGMGGIGKSTLAKELYNYLSKRFVAACYVEDVTLKVDQSDGIVKVQNCILNDLGPKGGMSGVTNKSMGKAIMEERLCKKCILLVLDDVCDDDKLSFLVSQKMLKQGSLCIVTSRNKRVFNAFMDYEVYIHDVQGLSSLDSIRVVASYAFGDHEKVKQGFEDLVENISKACGGIPLVLKVCGALLKNEEDVDVWRDVLKKLNSGTIMDEGKIFECLQISYDALQNDYQEMFLDITCVLLGKSRALAVRAWDSHGWLGALGIRTLVEKALVTVDKNGCLSMHNHLRDMGHEIVRRRRESDGVIRRLWMPESSTFLKGDVGLLKSLETLVVFHRSPSLINDLDISHMKKLRILMCDDSSKVMSSIPSLCWWDWHGPWFGGLETKRILPTILPNNKLVVLNLQRSIITTFPDTFQALTNLEVLNLKACEKLEMLPDSFSGLKNLRDLNLESSGITSLPQAFRGLVNLKVLNLSNCKKLDLQAELIGCLKMLRDLNLKGSEVAQLSESFGGLSNLEVLNLSKCEELYLLPKSFGSLNKLRDLNLEGSGISRLPESFGGLSKLEVLNLTACQMLQLLPHSVRCLQNVKDFSYSGSAFERLLQVAGELDQFEMVDIPSKLMKLSKLMDILCTQKELELAIFSIEELSKLFSDSSNVEVLSLMGHFKLMLLPSSIGGLQKLRDLKLISFGVASLPESFGELHNLEVLSLEKCGNLTLLPSSFGHLRKLRDLKLDGSGVSGLPKSFGELHDLEVLSLVGCSKLKLLPVSFGGLRMLRDLKLDGSGVSGLPKSFGELHNLEVLSLVGCSKLKLLPVSFGGLRMLRDLKLNRSGVSGLPKSFGELHNLEVLSLVRCRKLKMLPVSFGGLSSLRELNLLACGSLEVLPQSFTQLNNLLKLYLQGCPAHNSFIPLQHLMRADLNVI